MLTGLCDSVLERILKEPFFLIFDMIELATPLPRLVEDDVDELGETNKTR